MDVRLAWAVPEMGHTWKTYKGVQRLVWNRELKGGYANKYVPRVGLFRQFSAINTKPSRVDDAVLKFADEYGDITGLPGSSFYQLDETGERQIQRPNAPLKMWRFQIEQMRWAVGLWDRSNDEDLGKASRLEARKALQIEVDAALQDVKTPSCARVCVNARLELFVHPVNLLAFMWLTLARLLSGEIEERLCVGCRDKRVYIGSGPGLQRGNTVTCGPACRKRKQRGEAEV